jgi:predicted nucleic acid-binding protein
LFAERDLGKVRAAFTKDLNVFSIVELDEVTCERAAAVAEVTGVRSLDAMHLAAAQRVGGSAVTFVTFDIARPRQRGHWDSTSSARETRVTRRRWVRARSLSDATCA